MRAFHNEAKIKRMYVARVRAHGKADEIVKGKYWENGKGCAVGCTIHSGDHSKFETELGIPRILARLEDGIFESLPNELAKSWPLRFLKAIKVGSDLSQVWPKFAHWLLVDPEQGVINFAKTDRTKLAINNVSNLYLRSLKEEVTIKECKEARSAAYADAAYAADAAAAYAAAYAAYAAYAAADAYADAAYDAAAYAAYAAAYAANAADAADAAARTKARIAQSEKLLQLLSEAPAVKKRSK